MNEGIRQILCLQRYKLHQFHFISGLVSDVSSPSLGPPAHPKAILVDSSPPEAQKPEARTSLTKTPKILGSCMYINTRLPARPKQILHLPNPPKAQNLKKKAGSSPPEAQKLEARTSLTYVCCISFLFCIS